MPLLRYSGATPIGPKRPRQVASKAAKPMSFFSRVAIHAVGGKPDMLTSISLAHASWKCSRTQSTTRCFSGPSGFRTITPIFSISARNEKSVGMLYNFTSMSDMVQASFTLRAGRTFVDRSYNRPH